jgi:hypothetical protein
VARAIGWLFVGLIGYHAVRGFVLAARAGADGDWDHAAVLATLALVAGAIVIAAVAGALRSARAQRRT